MLEKITNSFVPLFFAIDVIGILPIYISMTKNIYVEKQRKIINQAAFTAFFISLGFIYLGKQTFHFLGITIPDFKVAGGILLLILSINDLLFPEKTRQDNGAQIEHLGVVPIGMPLIIGPGVLTTLLLSVGNNGTNATLIALILNIVLVWLAFFFSDRILKIVSEAGAVAIGKVFSLILSAIAVMMIRVGITEFISQLKEKF